MWRVCNDVDGVSVSLGDNGTKSRREVSYMPRYGMGDAYRRRGIIYEVERDEEGKTNKRKTV